MKFDDLMELAKKHDIEDIVEKIEIICEELEEHELFDHLDHVATIAVDLSENYRLDSERMHIASYLHDISKLVDFEEYEPILEKYNFELTSDEREAKSTIHAKVSMIIAKEIFGVVDEELLNSIYYHTTLRAYPTEYDKILFLADKMTWNDEELVYLLDETIMQVINVTCKNALEWIIKDIEDKNDTVVPLVKEAYEFFRDQMVF